MLVGDGQTLIGHGVTLRVDGELRFSSHATVQLTAHKGGTQAGLLIYMPLENHSRMVLNGGSDSDFQGTILAPSADVHLNGNDSNHGFRSQIVGYYIDVNSTDNIVIKYKDEQNYDAFKMPEVILSQ